MVLMDSGFRNNDSVLLDTLVRVRVPSCHMVSIATTTTLRSMMTTRLTV